VGKKKIPMKIFATDSIFAQENWKINVFLGNSQNDIELCIKFSFNSFNPYVNQIQFWHDNIFILNWGI
jgi:hypothetical protein